ncbi:methyltransferase [soil metagenome]
MNKKNKPTTDPTHLIQIRDSIYAIDLLITAVGHLDFFNWLSEHPSDLEEICSSLGLDPRPVDVMITLFKSYGLIKEEGGKFYNTILANEQFTNKYQGNLIPYYSIQTERPIVEKMLKVLKTGQPASWGGKKDEQEWEKAMQKPDFADKFTAGMNSRGAYLAPYLAQNFNFSNYQSFLDIAGGSGIYASAIAHKYPHLKATVLERPPVDHIARQALSKSGFHDKVSVLAGDMFKDEFPKGYDIHFFSHVLHDWNLDQNRQLVENSYRNLNTGGIIMILDAHLNQEKIGPVPEAEYSVLLMFATPGKCYAISELEPLLTEIGFKNFQHIPLVANRSLIIAQKI